jgi:glutathione peroxidase-family protein
MIEKEYPSVFDVPVKGIDGEENFLDKFRGNVLIFVNTTGHCGNAQQ